MEQNINVYTDLTDEELKKIKERLQALNKKQKKDYSILDYIDVLDLKKYLEINSKLLKENISEAEISKLMSSYNILDKILLVNSTFEEEKMNDLLSSSSMTYGTSNPIHNDFIRTLEVQKYQREAKREEVEKDIEVRREQKRKEDEASVKEVLKDIEVKAAELKAEQDKQKKEKEEKEQQEKEAKEKAEKEKAEKEKEAKEKAEKKKEEEEEKSKTGRYIDPETGEPYDPADRARFKKIFLELYKEGEDKKTEEQKRQEFLRRILEAAMESHDLNGVDGVRPSCGTIPLGVPKIMGAFENKINLKLFEKRK